MATYLGDAVFRLLLWNLNRPEQPDRATRVAETLIALSNDLTLDLFVFVEPPSVGSAIHLRLLNAGFSLWSRLGSRFAIFSAFSDVLASPIELPLVQSRYEAWRVEQPGRQDFTLFVVHGRDRRNHTQGARNADAQALAQDVRLVEEVIVGDDHTILAGDFNDAPFNASMSHFDRLHATSSQRIAERGVRTLRGRPSTPFYNPSWALLSDLDRDVPGTYFLDSPEEDESHWNVLDQVLLRSSLLGPLRSGGLRVVTKAGTRSLLTPLGRPDTDYSDHLPLLLELDF